ncbi:hypothetical protein Mapa_009447 [Marchantia paleacea]|nr:hypothetical protein Mapa_009447 [Marchantia paleacea]
MYLVLLSLLDCHNQTISCCASHLVNRYLTLQALCIRGLFHESSSAIGTDFGNFLFVKPHGNSGLLQRQRGSW